MSKRNAENSLIPKILSMRALFIKPHKLELNGHSFIRKICEKVVAYKRMGLCPCSSYEMKVFYN